MMQGDTFNYQRARTVSLLGLGLQVAMAAGLALYTAFSGGTNADGEPVSTDHAALTATVFAAAGVVVWASLAFLFDWHRRERAEAIEAERLAADPAASAFETAGEEMRVAARRLAGLQKFGLPIVSLSFAAVLITVGVVRLLQGRSLMAEPGFDPTPIRGWALVIGLATGFVGFVFARFVSGMAKQRVWASLRAGSSAAVGTALLGIAIAIAHFIDLASGPDIIVSGLRVAFPIFLIVIGAETVLNFVLDIYRPRRPGEDPRPAFDSRLLGLLAAPDKIAQNVGEALNYQFGIEVSRTWFYLLLQRWWSALVLLVALVMWAMTSVVIVEPHQRALILTFGRPPTHSAEPGLHFKWPWPISEVYIPESVQRGEGGSLSVSRTVTGVRTMTLGTNSPKKDAKLVLWDNDHVAGEEYYNLVQPTPAEARAGAAEAATTTSPFDDLSIVAAELPVHWVVDDVLLYDRFAEPGSREALIRSLGQRVALQRLSAASIDDVLGAERAAIAAEINQAFTQSLAALNDGAGPGIKILFLGAGNVHPHKDVAPSFERVVQAQQVKQSKLEQALQDRIRILTKTAPVATLDDGTRIDAAELVRLITALDQLRASGKADAAAVAVEEQRIQSLIERAGGDAGASLIEASAQRWRRHMGERGRAALYEGQLAGYLAAPGLYKARLYFDAVREAFRDSRVFLVAEGVGDLRVRVELQTDAQTSVFNPDAGAELQ